jgi:competence protein ComEA
MLGIDLSKRQLLALAAVGGICLIGLGIGAARISRHAALKQEDILAPKEDNSGIEIVTSSSQTVVVHVAGCVKNPNVYVMKPGDRVIDAINKAGGAKADADLDSLNLAEMLKDGEKIYVPSKNEAAAVPISPVGQSAQTKKSFADNSGPLVVNINTAGPEELDRLPGVGPATAQKIIEYRNQIGRFTSVEQLEEVRGIGPKKLEQMRPFIRL